MWLLFGAKCLDSRRIPKIILIIYSMIINRINPDIIKNVPFVDSYMVWILLNVLVRLSVKLTLWQFPRTKNALNVFN